MFVYVEIKKKIDIDIPKLNVFIHKTYINIARKLYKNIYLFEQDCTPLQKQKNNREFEMIIRECIVDTIRASIPTDRILRAYMSEKMEEEIEENITEQKLNDMVSKSETRVATEDDIPKHNSGSGGNDSQNSVSNDSQNSVSNNSQNSVSNNSQNNAAIKQEITIPTLPHESTEPVLPKMPAFVEDKPSQNNSSYEVHHPEHDPEPDIDDNLVIGDDLGMEPLDFDTLDIGGSMSINEDD